MTKKRTLFESLRARTDPDLLRRYFMRGASIRLRAETGGSDFRSERRGLGRASGRLTGERGVCGKDVSGTGRMITPFRNLCSTNLTVAAGIFPRAGREVPRAHSVCYNRR